MVTVPPPFVRGALARAGAPAALCALLLPAGAMAAPDLRTARPVGAFTVFSDHQRANRYYYGPGDLEIRRDADGHPDLRLLLVRYTGSVVHADRGARLFRSVLHVGLRMRGPSPLELTALRDALRRESGRAAIELRPLPLVRADSALIYAPVDAPSGASGSEGGSVLPAGHLDPGEGAQGAGGAGGFWTERTLTVSLSNADAQLLASALEAGQVALSVGYAFLADGIGPETPLARLTGSPELVNALAAQVGLPAPGPAEAAPDEEASSPSAPPRGHLVHAGAISITASPEDAARLIRRVDINESAPPGYAAIDVHCYDFQEALREGLVEKRVEVEAASVASRPARLTATFTRDAPDVAVRSLRFPVAVRLDRPYRYRIVEIAEDGTPATGPWQTAESWAWLLDVTARSGMTP